MTLLAWNITAIFILCGICIYTTEAAVKLYGLNYNVRKGPDWDPNKCKSTDEIRQDLQTLSAVTTRVRIYSLTDCGQGRTVLQVAKAVGLKVWLGIWVDNYTQTFLNEKQEFQSIVAAGLIDSNVLGIHVGSEAIYRKEVSPSQAIDYMKQIQAIAQASNLNLDVTIADIGDTYIAYPELIRTVPVVSANQFPFWEKKTPEESVPYALSRLDPLLRQLNGKRIIMSETGWASDGENPHASVASLKNQETYFKNFYCTFDQQLHWEYYYFAAFDDSWKNAVPGQEHDVEGHFGLYYNDRTMKPWFASFSGDCGNSTVNPTPSSTPTQPATPVPSSTPTQPVTPVPSSTPTQPATPVPSSTPTQPATPVPSSTPTQPATPVPSSTPTQPATPVPTNQRC